jgi:thymidylate kinase
MIILIEGPRGSGKSHLVDNFMESNRNPDVLYYKFAFSDWIKKLKFEDHETGPGVHYFSISNIITILDISNSFLKDKTVVFDRSIFSAYVWSILRDRMDASRLISEFSRFLSDEVYSNCKLIKVERLDPDLQISREKTDLFDKYEDYSSELSIYGNIIDIFKEEITDLTRGNEYFEFQNEFDKSSETKFNHLLNSIIDK